jgi:hypothetical protein
MYHEGIKAGNCEQGVGNRDGPGESGVHEAGD